MKANGKQPTEISSTNGFWPNVLLHIHLSTELCLEQSIKLGMSYEHETHQYMSSNLENLILDDLTGEEA